MSFPDNMVARLTVGLISKILEREAPKCGIFGISDFVSTMDTPQISNPVINTTVSR
jgi:hypothetical protein